MYQQRRLFTVALLKPLTFLNPSLGAHSIKTHTIPAEIAEPAFLA